MVTTDEQTLDVLDTPPPVEAPPKPKTTSRDICRALSRHYIGAEGLGEEWVLLEEARRGAGFTGNSNRCDLLAIGTWESRGLQLVGHEVKVSRQDWQKELKQPEKAEWIWKHCHQWFLVIPAGSKIVLPDELPASWGLMEVNASCVKVVTKAPINRDPVPVPWPMIVGWFAQLDRGGKRDIKAQLTAAREEGRRAGEKSAEAQSRPGRLESQAETIRATAHKFKMATGVDLFEEHTWRRDELVRFIQLTGWDGVPSLIEKVKSILNQSQQLERYAQTILDEHGDLGKARNS